MVDDDEPDPQFKKTRLGMGDLIRAAIAPTVSATPDGAESAFEAGTLGRYKVGPLIGQGGMGDVLLAFDEQIGRQVAIKRIRSATPSPEQRDRFVREARVQGRLEHPAIVPVYELTVEDAQGPYFVMKRLAGTNMQDLLVRMRAGEERDEPASRRALLRAFAEVCLAIEFAHKTGIVHRDLKPANITLGDFGEVYVLDWGVARALHATGPFDKASASDSGSASSSSDLELASGATRAGTVLGTPAYMAPEQLVGDPAGPEADIYALGCILFEILAGQPLHPRTRTAAQAASLADARPSQLRADAPPELDAVCLRATAFEPEDRFPSARALGAAVQAFLDGDRDVLVRKELAQRHLEEARAAIARGDEEVDRRSAIAAAGRALALDPTTTEAAELVTHLMLRPPREVPREVETQIEQLDTAAAQRQGRFTSAVTLGYLAFVPLILWTGMMSALPVIAIAIFSLGASLHSVWFSRRGLFTPGVIYTNASINAVLIGLVCVVVGPLIMGPTIVVMTIMGYASHPRFGHMRVIGVIVALGVVVPWVMELVGVLPSTYSFEGGKLVIESSIVRFSAAPTQVAFGMLLVLSVSIVAFLLRSVVLAQRDSTRRLEVQAWHLRQIVPTVSGAKTVALPSP